LSCSPIYRFPAESIATPIGVLKLALVAIPSTDPAELPTIVVTTPSDVILRTRWLIPSATYTFPAESTVTPLGALKVALVPVPFADPVKLDKLPAKVVTTPADVILRIRLLPVSPTYTFPAESNATP
jgi:hypothetical protein